MLRIVENVLEDLNTGQINYCHWKSNEHLNASVNGDTDLDVLFDENQEDKVIKILKSNGFHLFEAIWYKKYDGIVDYIGFDPEKGKTIHLHTHFHLDLGEVGIKSYHLPWEKLILDNKIYNSEYNIYTSSPAIEYLLLVVRTAFKRDLLNYRSNRRIINDFEKEAKWLYPKVKLNELGAIEVLSPEIIKLILEIRRKECYDKKLFLKLKKHLKLFFSEDRVLSKTKVFYLKNRHLFKSVIKRIEKLLKVKFKSLHYRRGLPNKGVIVSIMGCDGAGKSTQTNLVMKELRKKVDVTFMYMGSGKGAKSFQRQITDSIFNLGLRLRKKEYPEKENAQTTQNTVQKNIGQKNIGQKNILIQYVLSIKAISLAYERKKRLNKIKKEQKKGGIVVCDRYPQTSIPGHNDGLKLKENLKSKRTFLRIMARYEYKCYDLSNVIYPNLVIKLIGSTKILHSRRPEMTIEEIEKKQKGIAELIFPKETDTVCIDIEMPANDIKTKILNELSNQIKKTQKV